jgi:transcriptional regulator with XRE-family HTH domain
VAVGGVSMTIGEKITLLKESAGFKNYQDFGKAVGLSGDWLLDLSKKQGVSTIDMTRLIKIADYFNVTLDWLLKDNDNNYIIDVKKDLAEDDIGVMLDNIKNKISEGNTKFYGYSMNNEVSKLANDAIDVVKKLIKQNL